MIAFTYYTSHTNLTSFAISESTNNLFVNNKLVTHEEFVKAFQPLLTTLNSYNESSKLDEMFKELEQEHNKQQSCDHDYILNSGMDIFTNQMNEWFECTKCHKTK